MTVHEDMMINYPPSLAAAKKIGTIEDGFSFYRFEWLGNRPEEWTVMKCSGAVFREAKTGKHKGQRCIKVPGTERTVFITSDEIVAAVPIKSV